MASIGVDPARAPVGTEPQPAAAPIAPIPLPAAEPPAAAAACPVAPRTNVSLGGKTAPFSSGLSLPPVGAPAAAAAAPAAAATAPAAPVGEYQAAFGSEAYVKDGGNTQLQSLMQQAAGKLPELANNPQFAADLKSGHVSPVDIKTLQTAMQAHGYSVGSAGVDGKYGPQTHAALQALMSGAPPTAQPNGGPTPAGSNQPAGTTPTGAPDASGGTSPANLDAHLNNKYKGVKHECFHYAWGVTQASGGKGITSAAADHQSRGQSAQNLDNLVAQGKIKPGDVIYTNNSPGSDPTSTKMQYGPHWFVYKGNGQFADQYGVKSGAQMAGTSSWHGAGKIDTIYHPY